MGKRGRRKVVFLWRSGLKWFERFENEPHAIYDPKRGEFLYGSVEPGEDVLIVDDEVASGLTLFKTLRDLKPGSYEIAAWDVGGTFRPDVPLPPPTVNAPMLTFVGLAGVGKSYLARSVARAFGLPYVKWGDFAKPFAGRYGEELERLEQKDPFFLARRVYARLKDFDPQRPVVLDNPKKEEQVTFVAFATRRPLLLFFVEVSGHLRHLTLRLRGDADDAFLKERDALFKAYAERLRQKSVLVRADSNDHSDALWLLERHGFDVKRGFYPGTLFFKPAILDWLLKVSLSKRVVEPKVADGLELVPERYRAHYLKRYASVFKDARKRGAVLRLSIAYRLIDDVLDEHALRNGEAAFHVERSVFEAIFVASLLVANAKALLEHKEFELFRRATERAYEAVKTELEFELEPSKRPSLKDYVKTLEREAAFRAFVYALAGLDAKEGFKRGLLAQLEDDVKGAKKHGREDTEKKLNRPARYARAFEKAVRALVERGEFEGL